MNDRDIFTPVLFGIIVGAVVGTGLVVANVAVTGVVHSAAGRRGALNAGVEFGPPLDRAGSLEYLAVQVLFLAAAVALLVIGIRRARQAPFIAASSIVAAIIMGIPFVPCTLGAVQNALACCSRG